MLYTISIYPIISSEHHYRCQLDVEEGARSDRVFPPTAPPSSLFIPSWDKGGEEILLLEIQLITALIASKNAAATDKAVSKDALKLLPC